MKYHYIKKIVEVIRVTVYFIIYYILYEKEKKLP